MAIAGIQQHPLPTSGIQVIVDPTTILNALNALPSVAMPAVGAAGTFAVLNKSGLHPSRLNLGATVAAFMQGYGWNSLPANVSGHPGR